MNTKIVVITGMHRSGTSLVAQWLHRCGLYLGDNLLGPNIGNIQGHFEDDDFLNLHRQFLKKRHLPSTGFVHEPVKSLTGKEVEAIQQLIYKKSQANTTWGWKEPRTTLFLKTYTTLLPSAFFIVVVRSYKETISSMLTREYKENAQRFATKKGLSKIKWILFKRKSLEKILHTQTETYLKVWIEYYEQVIAHVLSLSKNKVIVVSYTTLAQDDHSIFEKMKEEWQLDLNYISFNEVYNGQLMSEVLDIKKYIKDKSLLERAQSIERYIRLNYLKTVQQV